MGTIDGKGSNNWVVAGNRSTSGKPLLSNDPHLGLSAPAIWYFVHLEAPESKAEDGRVTPALNAIGATLPGQPDVKLTVRESRHGPVLSDAQKSHTELLDTGKYVLALRWGALDIDNQTILSGLRSNAAQSIDDLEAAFSTYHSPMQSVVMADIAGRTAFKAVGKLPLRKPDNDILGIAPSPGWDARYDWA